MTPQDIANEVIAKVMKKDRMREIDIRFTVLTLKQIALALLEAANKLKEREH